MMPGMSGIEALEYLNIMEDNKCKGIPVIAMTANAFEEDKKEALRNGMNGHIAKPIDIDLFLSILRKYLG